MEEQRNHIVKFLKIFFFTLLIIFCFDQLGGFILQKLYYRQMSGLYFRTTYAIDSTKADVLIFGSSRANHHYVPDIFEDSLKMSFYNTGQDGQGILFNLAVERAILKRYTPKIVILDINYNELEEQPVDYDRLGLLLPYYNNHSEIKDIILKKSKFEQIKVISKLYRYNSTLLTILMGNLEMNKLRKGDIKGYVPLKYVLDASTKKGSLPMHKSIDTFKYKAMQEFINNAENKNIKLYLVFSPYFANVKNNQTFVNCKDFANKNPIHFINYANDSLFLNNPTNFADNGHLNDKGARAFSSSIVHQILINN